ncbi:MAG: DedA family protein [Candidatus Sericytochromatia bacterium]
MDIFSQLADLLKQALSLFLHLDDHLKMVIETYGTWTYLLLFVIIFCETGLVVTPFLPGDSLLFAAGTFAALGSLNLALILFLLAVAAVLGDALNYWIGYHLGPRVFRQEEGLFFKKAYLDKTQAFYDKYGGKTIILARFVPIVRTFAPFVAGIGRMPYRIFFLYNILGGLLWVGVCTLAGFLFGNIPIVQKNFELAIIGIILVSILPMALEFLKHRTERKRAEAQREMTQES